MMQHTCNCHTTSISTVTHTHTQELWRFVTNKKAIIIHQQMFRLNLKEIITRLYIVLSITKFPWDGWLMQKKKHQFIWHWRYSPSCSSCSNMSTLRARYLSRSSKSSNSSSSLVRRRGRLGFRPNWLLSSNRLRISYLYNVYRKRILNNALRVKLSTWTIFNRLPVYHERAISHPGN